METTNGIVLEGIKDDRRFTKDDPAATAVPAAMFSIVGENWCWLFEPQDS